jgi:hypothetical protein
MRRQKSLEGERPSDNQLTSGLKICVVDERVNLVVNWQNHRPPDVENSPQISQIPQIKSAAI